MIHYWSYLWPHHIIMPVSVLLWKHGCFLIHLVNCAASVCVLSCGTVTSIWGEGKLSTLKWTECSKLSHFFKLFHLLPTHSYFQLETPFKLWDVHNTLDFLTFIDLFHNTQSQFSVPCSFQPLSDCYSLWDGLFRVSAGDIRVEPSWKVFLKVSLKPALAPTHFFVLLLHMLPWNQTDLHVWHCEPPSGRSAKRLAHWIRCKLGTDMLTHTFMTLHTQISHRPFTRVSCLWLYLD